MSTNETPKHPVCDSCGGECVETASGISIPSRKIQHTIIVCVRCLSTAQQILAKTRLLESVKTLPQTDRILINNSVCFQSVKTNALFVRGHNKKIRKIG